ncbi:MAG: glyoxalase [Bacteroidetes bacterium]|nr:glyoxalase [Bacteroidota bacterium]
MQITAANLTINVSDLEKSIIFYQSLGLKLEKRWGNHYAQLTAPGLVIGLHPTKAVNIKASAGNVSIGFISDDFETTKSELTALSIDISERKEEGGNFIHFNDPDGTALYFIQPKW